MNYSIDFAERLIDAAESFFHMSSAEEDAGRAVLYLSLLSCEISLKSLLESAGFAPNELRQRSHSLAELLTDVCHCEVPDLHIGSYASASGLLAVQPIPDVPAATVGKILDAENAGASTYPNEIRYGEFVRHYEPHYVLCCARSVCKWVRVNMDDIRKKK
ncbi:MAG: hypothetical protein Tsb0027_13430 [Wenzhouxiangellaceae bacterium]